MKKFVCLMMALAMVFSLSVTAGAEAGNQTLNTVTPTASIDVTVTVDQDDTEVYSVGVTWKDLTFTYETAWDGSAAKYTGNWKEEDGKTIVGKTITVDDAITVTNKSNANIFVQLAYANEDTKWKNYLTGEITGDSYTNTPLASTANCAYAFALTVTDGIDTDAGDTLAVGTITVRFQSSAFGV